MKKAVSVRLDSLVLDYIDAIAKKMGDCPNANRTAIIENAIIEEASKWLTDSERLEILEKN